MTLGSLMWGLQKGLHPMGQYPREHFGGKAGITSAAPCMPERLAPVIPSVYSGVCPRYLIYLSARNKKAPKGAFFISGGKAGIRTLGGVTPSHAFEACALDQLGHLSTRYLRTDEGYKLKCHVTGICKGMVPTPFRDQHITGLYQNILIIIQSLTLSFYKVVDLKVI